MWNALALITFAGRVKTWKDARLTPFSLFREQFDRRLPVLAGDSQRLQMVASTYVRGMTFERSINGLRAMEGRLELSPETIKDALDLSMGFQIVFRSLGPRVLSKVAMEEFEMTLNVSPGRIELEMSQQGMIDGGNPEAIEGRGRQHNWTRKAIGWPFPKMRATESERLLKPILQRFEHMSGQFRIYQIGLAVGCGRCQKVRDLGRAREI